MFLSKISSKNYCVCIAMFVVGMLSVSVANIFGGYYCSVAAIETILCTAFIYNLFDKKIDIKENVVCISLVSLITLLEIIFFVVNDVFNIDVYIKGNLNFFGMLILISQIVSIISIVYFSVCYFLVRENSRVEVIEETNCEKEESEVLNETVNEKYKASDVEEKKESNDVKAIQETTTKVDVPFMEEER